MAGMQRAFCKGKVSSESLENFDRQLLFPSLAGNWISEKQTEGETLYIKLLRGVILLSEGRKFTHMDGFDFSCMISTYGGTLALTWAPHGIFLNVNTHSRSLGMDPCWANCFRRSLRHTRHPMWQAWGNVMHGWLDAEDHHAKESMPYWTLSAIPEA